MKVHDKMKVVHSICPQCSVGCGINLINIDNRLVGTYPYKRHPINEGKNCKKGRDCIELVFEENRPKNPLVNKNGTFSDYSWEEALDLFVSKIKSYTPQDIGIIGSGNSTNEDLEILSKFADALGVEKKGFYAENFPAFNIETATLDDVQSSNFILIVGDVIKESPLIGRKIILARENGAEVVSADSADKTFTGLNSDKYIKIRSIGEFLDNIGPEVHNKLKDSATIIFNKLDLKEEFEKIQNIAEDSGSKILPVLKQCNTRGAMRFLPALNQEEISRLINDVKFLYVVGDNPALFAEESFKNLDFLVTQSSSINETVLLSDLVFPASCWVEKTGTFTNTTGDMQKISKTISAPAEVLEDQRIISKIAEKIGIELGDKK